MTTVSDTTDVSVASEDPLIIGLFQNDQSIKQTWMKALYTFIACYLYVCAWVVGCLGVLGNIIMIVVLVKNKRLRKSNTNLYILNQSCIDCTAAFLLLLVPYIEDGGRRFVTLADDLLCRMWLTHWPLWGILVSSTYSLVCITVERFMAIVHPIWHRNHMKRRYVIASMVILWFLGPLNVSYHIYTSGIGPHEKCYRYSFWPSKTLQRSWGIVVAFIQFIVPIIIHCYCYIRMALVLVSKKDMIAGNASNTSGTSASEVNRNARVTRNIIKTLALVTICFFLCWVWNQMMWLSFNLGLDVDFNSVFSHLATIAVFTNSCVNPIVYMIKYDQFKKALREMLCPNTVEPSSVTGNSSTAGTVQSTAQVVAG